MKRKGFYLMGNFSKGKRPSFMIENEKPFEIDTYEGTVSPKVIRAYPKNFAVYEWFFVENHKITDINNDTYLRDLLNEIWLEWCEKYKRKGKPILKHIDTPLEVKDGNIER